MSLGHHLIISSLTISSLHYILREPNAKTHPRLRFPLQIYYDDASPRLSIARESSRGGKFHLVHGDFTNLLRRRSSLTNRPGLSVRRHATSKKNAEPAAVVQGRTGVFESLVCSWPRSCLRGSRFAGTLVQVSLAGRILSDAFPWECSPSAVECT